MSDQPGAPSSPSPSHSGFPAAPSLPPPPFAPVRSAATPPRDRGSSSEAVFMMECFKHLKSPASVDVAAVAAALGYNNAHSVSNRVRAIKKKFGLQVVCCNGAPSPPATTTTTTTTVGASGNGNDSNSNSAGGSGTAAVAATDAPPRAAAAFASAFTPNAAAASRQTQTQTPRSGKSRANRPAKKARLDPGYDVRLPRRTGTEDGDEVMTLAGGGRE